MRGKGFKLGKLLLIGLLAIFLIVPAAAANEQVSLLFNGQEYQADFYVENGVSFIAAASLVKIPGLEIEQEGYVALRSFFESRGAEVGWNSADKQVSVSWREKSGDWTAEELVAESTRLLQEINTYRMKGIATMKMSISGPGAGDVPQMPEMSTYMDGVFQQEPLAMYMKQTIELPVQDIEMSEEELALFGQGAMITEMVWTDNAIYQKMPPLDQWIVQDLGQLDMMDNLTNMLQMTPQQSLEMMSEFGIIYVFGDDAVIEGQEYYTVKNYVDSATFKKVIDELLGGFDLSGLVDLPELDEKEMEEAMKEMQQAFKQIFATMELTYYVDTFINKDTLLTDFMAFDMDMKYKLDETMNPEGPVDFGMKMIGEAELYDYGTEIELPDVSEAMTQQEYMELMMKMMEMPQE